MTDPVERVARCACGQLELRASGDPDVAIACNCHACQQRTGSAFGIGAYYKKDAIVGTVGKASTFERTAETGRKLEYHFCPACGTNLWWSLEMRPEHVGVAGGCFTDTSFLKPARTIWTKSKQDWLDFPEDLPAFEGPSPA